MRILSRDTTQPSFISSCCWAHKKPCPKTSQSTVLLSQDLSTTFSWRKDHPLPPKHTKLIHPVGFSPGKSATVFFGGEWGKSWQISGANLQSWLNILPRWHGINSILSEAKAYISYICVIALWNLWRWMKCYRCHFFLGGPLIFEPKHPRRSIEVLLQKSPWFGMTRWWRNWVTWSFSRADGSFKVLNGWLVHIGRTGIHWLVELRRFGVWAYFLGWKLLMKENQSEKLEKSYLED